MQMICEGSGPVALLTESFCHHEKLEIWKRTESLRSGLFDASESDERKEDKLLCKHSQSKLVCCAMRFSHILKKSSIPAL